MRLLSLCAFGSLALAACSGSVTSSGPSASVQGTAAGQTVTVNDDIGLVGTMSAGGAHQSYAGVLLTNKAGTCGIIQSNTNPASVSALSLLVAISSAGTPPAVGPGTYAINDGTAQPPDANGNVTVAGAAFVVNDASCVKVTDEKASAGTITISSVTSGMVTGHFDVTFPAGDHLTGDFSSPVCSVDLAAVAQAPITACQK